MAHASHPSPPPLWWADQRLLGTLTDEKDPRVLATGLEILTCVNSCGWGTPSGVLSLGVHGMLVRVCFLANADRGSSAMATNGQNAHSVPHTQHENAQVAANAKQLLSMWSHLFHDNGMRDDADLSAVASRLVGRLIDNTELEWVRVDSLVSLTLDYLALQPTTLPLRDILPLELFEALCARMLGFAPLDRTRAHTSYTDPLIRAH
jgi:hypothetical protein